MARSGNRLSSFLKNYHFGKLIGAGFILVALSLFLTAAPADSLSIGKARELIQNIAGANLKKDQVKIKKITSGAGGVVVDAEIETAFRMSDENGDWRIAEVRLGDRQWESFELIEEAVRREKERRTLNALQEISKGLAAYRRDRGQYIETDDIGELLDFLSPKYLSVPLRFDWWGKQFEYRGKSSGYNIRSTGADHKSGTNDDLIIENGVIISESR